jgi:hypothetical protein
MELLVVHEVTTGREGVNFFASVVVTKSGEWTRRKVSPSINVDGPFVYKQGGKELFCASCIPQNVCL